MHILQGPGPELDALLDSGEFFWLDLEGPGRDVAPLLDQRFGLHPLAVEDTRELGQRPKLDDYGETALLVYYGAREDGSLIEVHLHLSGRWMITAHADPCPPLAHAAHRIRERPPGSEEEAIYHVLDALTDSFFPLLEALDDEVDTLMDDMMERQDNAQREQLLDLRRRLMRVRRVVAPQRDLFVQGGDVLATLPGLEADDARDWFRDLYDHSLRIYELLDDYRDQLSGALDIYVSTVSNRLNDVTKQLTIIATIFLPLTFVTGFFGQNFGVLVHHIDTAAAFWGYGVGGLIVSGLALWWWFRRAGLLGS